ncbi:MAG: hypothetical protein LBH07_01395 [Treponema sp.]|nr:hypothetical protein [Treponema sp.]
MKPGLLVFCLVFLNVHFLRAQESGNAASSVLFTKRTADSGALVFPPRINFFRYSESSSKSLLYGFPESRIWGWSGNGKVAYSTEAFTDGRGGFVIEFIIFDLTSDRKLFELRIDSYDHYNEESDNHNWDSFKNNSAAVEDLYTLFSADILNALRIHNIIAGQKTDFLSLPFRKNNMVYNSRIIAVEHRKDESGLGLAFDDIVSRYTVLVTADSKRKIIGNFNPVNSMTFHVYVCGYILSPFENRALLILAEEYWGFEGTELAYRLSGCHLGVGFN